MADLIDLTEERKAREEEELAVWNCDCGCTTHYVRNDGEIECAQCGALAEGIGYWRIPDTDDGPREADEDDLPVRTRLDVGEHGAREWARARCRQDDVEIIVSVHDGGFISAWHNSEDKEYVRRKMREAASLLTEEID